ncbi:hypothetical protein DW352_15855 [Pseudolabrys taiwanensis]|uniref:Uncharacterized protein n=1 Tax=Pseudolabrys taiwanensis TaxID=331696 RepID=A0A345ZY71_9HYPH|nr:DUF6580 family putative transport protein [Pseudolabrys taiwanensis]AXK81868.1 hypothetical protein DW352_15855 [Pseudolabrys taiwanensis]
MQPNTARHDLRLDLALIAFLIALDVAARLLPHAWGFTPVAASGLFAARMLRLPLLAVIVPVAAMALTGWALGADDWRVSLITYAAIAAPALLGIASRRFQGALPIVATMLAGSLAFFALSNAAVWAFSGMYPLTMAGLTECFVAALPFLDKTILGDLIWTGVLFGGAWLVQHTPALKRAH